MSLAPLAVSTFVWVFILVPLIVVWVLGIVDILRRPLSRQKKAGWIIVVLVLPLVGTLLYFALRKPSEEEIRAAQEARADLREDYRRGPSGGIRGG
jgi:hypothetical protein